MYRVLIVDDEYEIRNGLIMYLPWKDMGFDVAGEAENGMQALEYLSGNPVDVVLCDIKMPVMSGIEFAKEAEKRKLKPKIVFLSGYREFEYACQAVDNGVKIYIEKSAKYEELIEAFIKLKSNLDDERKDKEEIVETTAEMFSKGYDYNKKVIDSVKAYIEDHFRNATLDEAARLVHLNPNYLSRFFRLKTGKRFHDYLIDVRMQKAAVLLKDIKFRAYQVSDVLGYENSKSFTRAFRKYYGKSPREFKGEHEE